VASVAIIFDEKAVIWNYRITASDGNYRGIIGSSKKGKKKKE
jgi:hypothetical protein